MEGRKRSGMLKKSVYNMRKRLVAFALAAAMVCTNVGADLNAAYAATSSSESVTFEMTGSQLVTAIEEAIENGNVISPGDLDFTNGDIAKFESLFYGEGKVLEVFPDPDGGSMDAELRVFVRLPEDADDMYMVTGDEEIIFLYVNNGEDTVSFSTTIYDDEGGKLKSTKAIRVKSFEDAFGEEEINYISKPTETTAPAEDNGPAMEESTAPTESETAAPEEGTTAAPEEGTTVAPEEGTTVAPEETPTAAEESSSEAPSESETDSATEAEQTEPETTEAPETTEEKAQEPETPEAEVAEPENTTGEPVASITRHYAPIVADNEEGAVPEQPKADAAEEHVEEPKETTEAEVETEEKEPETTEKATEATEPTEVTDSAESTDATEETSAAVPDATTEAGGEDVNPGESTPAEETTTAPEEVDETTTAVETPAVTEPVQTGTPSEVTKPEEVKPEENVSKAETNDIVGMGYCSTAKAYVTRLKELKVLKGQIELSATVDGAENVNVTLTANPGVVPQGSYIEATAISDDSELELMKQAANEKLNRQNLAAVDIFAADVKLFDTDGNEIQPNGSVKVTFKGTEIDSSESVVYHMDDENSGISTLSLDTAEPNPYTAETVTNIDAGDDEAVFVTNHFSIYAEIETEERYYYEVNFWYAEDGQNDVLISGPQYVEEGHDAILPAAPEVEGYVFVGWNPSPQNILADSNIYAQYSKTADLIRLTVNYIYSDGTAAAQPWVAEVQAGVKCNYDITSPEIAGFIADQTEVSFKDVYSEDQTVTVTYKGGEANYQVKHYLLNPDGSQPTVPVDTETLAGEVGLNTQAVAKEYEGFTPKPIAQVAIGSDGETVVEVHYERNLYTLTWDTGEGGSYIAPTEVVYGAAVDKPIEEPTRLGYEFLGWGTIPTTMPAQDTVVTAKWKGATYAAYKVVYWQETLTVGQYAVHEVESGYGSVGREISARSKNYEGFKLSDKQLSDDIKITADGLAVKNVYYDREQYTIKFNKKVGRTWQEDISLRITARYGENVSEKWIAANSDGKWSEKKDYSNGPWYTLMSSMPAKNLVLYGPKSVSGYHIIYYIEDLDGRFVEFQTLPRTSATSTLGEEDQMPIEGFKYWDWKQSGGYQDLWLKYTRKEFNINFFNCADMSTKAVKFEAPLIKGMPTHDPERPAGVDKDYEFAGWYLDPGFSVEVDWENTTMPADGISVYAKWVAPQYELSFETNGGDFIDSISVTKGDVIKELPVPVKDGDVFLGWYTDPQMTKKYIAESKIVKDTILYARWESSDTVDYIVKYVSSVDGSDIALEEKRNAELGSTVSEVAKSIDNYYPKATVLTVKITERNQEIVFEYTPVEKWTYTVNYLLEGTQDAVPGSSSLQDETSDHELAVNFKSFEGYTLVSAPVVSVTKDKPEAVFLYREKKAIYHTQHWFERVSYVGETNRFGLHDITTTTSVESGIPVSAQALDPVPEGFTLDTSIAGTIASGTTDIQNILTMKLFYVRSSYDVKYVIDGPQPEGVNIPTGGSYKYKETVTLEPPISVPGYTFSGWDTDDVALSNGKFMMPTHDVTLKGTFEINKYQVKVNHIDEDTGKAIEGQEPDELNNVDYGTTINGETYKRNIEKYAYTKAESKSVTADGVEVNVYYSVDDNETGTPDKYEVEVTYRAENGEIDPDHAEKTFYVVLFDTDNKWATAEDGGVGRLGADQVATATGNTGYHLSGWTPGEPKEGYELTVNTEFVATFEINKYQVKVNHIDEDTGKAIEGQEPDELNNVDYGTTINGETYKRNIEKYAYTKAESKSVTADGVEVNVYYSADVKGGGPDGKEPDGVPDKYETIFVYKSADVTKGTVDADPLKAEVHVFKDADGNYTDKMPVNPNGAIATPLDGFAFDYWTDSEVNDYTPDMSKMKTNTYLVDTTFIAYFDVDEIGIEVPNEPDGVPDKYQIKFQYVSEDTNRGTVSGRVTEVKTVYEIVTGEDGNDHRELKPASPDANVTVSSLGSYLFNNWTDGSRGYANADEIRAAEFTQSTTFTAQFRFNGGGGTGPGGGGGPSGNTEGNGRYNPSTVGPGTTTITPEDVPLAPLPESPVDVTLIDDGEVPLAPLPKTGQTSMRTTLTMMLSGIFVAVTALSKKRKEEDS